MNSYHRYIADLIEQADEALAIRRATLQWSSVSEALRWYARWLATSAGPRSAGMPHDKYGTRIDSSPRIWTGEEQVTAATIDAALDKLREREARWADVVIRSHVIGETQTALAKAYEVDQSTICRWIARGTTWLRDPLAEAGIIFSREIEQF